MVRTMHAQSRTRRLQALAIGICLAATVAAAADDEDIVATKPASAAAPIQFSDADNALLEEVQHGAFLYFWNEVCEPVCIVRDRKLAPVASSAAIGFQLSSLPIGVEHEWITREQGQQRALTILRSLSERTDNKHLGVYLHFPDMHTAGVSHEGYELLASTVDHALLLAGVITAGEYFGGEVKRLADAMVADTNWKAFVLEDSGYLSMGWKPTDRTNIHRDGDFLKAKWSWASDEERLLYFLAVGSPTEEFAIEPAAYYRLDRSVKRYKDGPPFVVSWPGSLFTYLFSHCWIDYRRLGADNPSRFGVKAPRVDWFENSRRAVLTQRRRCIEQASKFKTLAEDRWGLSSCAGRDGYIVPEIPPNASNAENWYEGTVAPYAAVSSIMLAPRESLVAIHAFRNLKDDDGAMVAWRDPSADGYGFVDAFNLDQGYTSDDYVGIDQGPILLAIENARTGLIWRLFMGSQTAQRATERLKLR